MKPWSRELRSLTVLKMTVRVTWNINLVLVVCRKGETKSSYFVVKPDEIWCGAGRSMIELHACALSFSFHFSFLLSGRNVTLEMFTSGKCIKFCKHSNENRFHCSERRLRHRPFLLSSFSILSAIPSNRLSYWFTLYKDQ